MKGLSLGLHEALRLTLGRLKPLPAENVALLDSVDRVAASNLSALVDSPPTATSRKDGYAVRSRETAHATPENPVRLRLLGCLAAGDAQDLRLEPGTTVRVLTGARIPTGADVVVAEEFARQDDSGVLIAALADTTNNILPRGGDVAAEDCVLRAGQKISPLTTGLLAAAGHHAIPVRAQPLVGIMGTGNEIVEPGRPLGEGKLYASNIVTLAGFCRHYQMKTRLGIVRDEHDAMLNALAEMIAQSDAVITSGGAWRGDHDIVAQVLDDLGWEKVFHRIRIGPGKAVGFGMLDKKPVFILPGGPPSNLMGFLQIALPGLLTLSGHADPGLPKINARLASELGEGKANWTDFFFGTLAAGDGLPVFHPMPKRSRLSSIADAAAVAAIPEGQDHLPRGSLISVQLLVGAGGLGKEL